jgi:hypothetical protein
MARNQSEKVMGERELEREDDFADPREMGHVWDYDIGDGTPDTAPERLPDDDDGDPWAIDDPIKPEDDDDDDF